MPSPPSPGTGLADDAAAVAPSGWKYALLLISVAASSLATIFIDGRGPLVPLAEALDSPTVPVAPLGPITSPAEIENSDRGGNNDSRSEAVDERAQEISEAVHPAEEGADILRESEDLHGGDGKGEGSPYEKKVQKQQMPLSNSREQRQKQRQRQRQKQQPRQPQQNDVMEQADGKTEQQQQQPQQEPQQQQQQQQQQHSSSQAEYDAYMHWCHKVLGISSVVEIKEFEYLDHLQMLWDENDDSENEQFDWLQPYSAAGDVLNIQRDNENVVELPTRTVRGLAATHDIQVGDVVISVPLYSLLSVPTTIDHDPILSRILGPVARKSYGWTDTSEYEVPLLVLAVLYHRGLGSDSPLSHYIDILLGTPVDSFPFLWTDRELRERTGGDAGEEVRRMARGIRSDLREMYDSVMGTLVKERPEWFAPPSVSVDGEEEEEEGWAYSYENFRWAFTLVISRHHYLPLQDFDERDENIPHNRPSVQSADAPSQQGHDTEQIMHETLSSVSEVVPPANQPTDSWVDLAKNEERVTEDDYLVVAADDDDTIAQQSVAAKHSFLAPLADLINFGPPCLTGGYNADDRAFDLVATCPFSKGQEVTFWYSSDCGDVIAASFGFLHPLVPPCPRPGDAEDAEKGEEEWREEAALRETELWEAYRRMDLLKEEMAALEGQLVSCECEDGERKGKGTESAEGATAAGAGPKVRIRGRINESARLNQEMMEELG